MSKEEKLKAVKDWLNERNIEFRENHWSKSCNVLIDIRVKTPLLAIRVSKEDDEEFFHAVKLWYSPIFIRECESVEFVLEKIHNTVERRLAEIEKMKQRKAQKELNRLYSAECARIAAEKKQAKEARKKAMEAPTPKRRRQRIVRYEKVSR